MSDDELKLTVQKVKKRSFNSMVKRLSSKYIKEY